MEKILRLLTIRCISYCDHFSYIDDTLVGSGTCLRLVCLIMGHVLIMGH